jgi:asparagine synthase (glutamine-hydrolysing)
MCGIFGLYNHSGFNNKLIENSLNNISHRGPDNSALWHDEKKKIILGHNRLSIIDLSEKASQPMFDPSTNLVIVYNGELYNYKELRTQLSKNYKFYTSSDTEVLIKAYDYWNENCLNYLNGMFAFSIYDINKNKIFAARDKSGQKPFFYASLNGNFIFSSELKSILPLVNKNDINVEINSLNCLLDFGYIPNSNCIYKNFRKLPASHFLEFDLNEKNIKVKRYWAPKISTQKLTSSFNDSKKEFSKIFNESVKRHTLSDVPIGVLLSGGIDSSLVTAFASKHLNNLKTFTVIFPNQNIFNEQKYARIVSKHFSTDHTEIEINEKIIPEKILPYLAAQYDEPIFDSSMLPTYLVCKEVSRHCKVVLGGDGADELFGGYHHHQRILITKYLKKFLPQNLWSMISNFSRLLPAGFKGKIWLESLKYDLNIDLPNIATIFNEIDRKELLGNYFSSESKLIRKKSIFQSTNLIDRILWTDFVNYLTEDILVKTDRASMANSLELRAPFLDNDVINFALNLNNSFKLNVFEKKIFLKRLGDEILPPELNLKRKQGFAIPIDDWIRNNKPWKNYFEHILLEADYLFVDKKKILELYNSHKKGLNLGEKLFGLVMFILWQKAYID